jgi:hypothetical protein
MSENDLESPAPDVQEQQRGLSGEPEAPSADGLGILPLDVNEADAVEQHREVELDEDDYR